MFAHVYLRRNGTLKSELEGRGGSSPLVSTTSLTFVFVRGIFEAGTCCCCRKMNSALGCCWRQQCHRLNSTITPLSFARCKTTHEQYSSSDSERKKGISVKNVNIFGRAAGFSRPRLGKQILVSPLSLALLFATWLITYRLIKTRKPRRRPRRRHTLNSIPTTC